jgi:hypothetical protein
MGSFIVWVLRQLLRKEYEKAESFWMVLGGVEVNSGCRDSRTGGLGKPGKLCWSYHGLMSAEEELEVRSTSSELFTFTKSRHNSIRKVTVVTT